MRAHFGYNKICQFIRHEKSIYKTNYRLIRLEMLRNFNN